jgi:hypothetical protein
VELRVVLVSPVVLGAVAVAVLPPVVVVIRHQSVHPKVIMEAQVLLLGVQIPEVVAADGAQLALMLRQVVLALVEQAHRLL